MTVKRLHAKIRNYSHEFGSAIWLVDLDKVDTVELSFADTLESDFWTVIVSPCRPRSHRLAGE